MIEASCHCGNVKINIPASTETVTSCNCSACSRFGALWAYFDPENVNVMATEENIGSYSWGDKTIEFQHCKNCGCITHYTPTELGNMGRMAVNFRLVDPKIVKSVKVRYFDGADKWEFVEER